VGWFSLTRNQQRVAARGGLCEPLPLAVQRIGGEQHVGEAKLGDQLRQRRDLVRRTGQLLMGENEGGVAGEGAEHMRRLALVHTVEAAAQRLAVERDRARPSCPGAGAQRASVPAEGGLQIVAVERQEEMPQRVHGRGAPEAGAEDGVQALALQGDEGDDAAVGGRPREHGEDRGQQQVAHAVALPLGAAWVAYLGERGKQRSKRHWGGLHDGERSLP
jgi:hypothetical protein